MIEKHGRSCVYSIQYHIVWCVKYRKKILSGRIKESLKSALKQISFDNKFEIISMETNLDHIHLLIDCSPQHYIPDMIKALKGVSARYIFKACPEIKKELWGGSLWNPSYYVGTVSDRTEEQIKRYIENQKEE